MREREGKGEVGRGGHERSIGSGRERERERRKFGSNLLGLSI